MSSVSNENFACEVFLVIHVLMVGGLHQTQSIEDSGKGIEVSSILAKFVKISTVARAVVVREASDVRRPKAGSLEVSAEPFARCAIGVHTTLAVPRLRTNVLKGLELNVLRRGARMGDSRLCAMRAPLRLRSQEVDWLKPKKTKIGQHHQESWPIPSSASSPSTVFAIHEPSIEVLHLPSALPRSSSRQIVRGLAIAVISTICAAQVLDSLSDFCIQLFESVSILVDGIFVASMCAGFIAQLVDGALGMGFGITSTTVMVSLAGLSPLAASTSVHLAQLGTTALSGLSHYSYGNVDQTTLCRMAPAGMAGAFAGATFLATMSPRSTVPISAGLLFGLGAYVLGRFCLRAKTSAQPSNEAPGWGLLVPLGLWGGFVDATGGGGWGPVATTGLLTDGHLTPAKVVGTVSAVEFLVTVAAVAGFVGQLGTNIETIGARVDLVFALLVGGMLAAPVAPLLVSSLEPETLGVSIGGFICLTNARVLLKVSETSPSACTLCYVGIVLTWLLALHSLSSRRGPSGSVDPKATAGLYALRASFRVSHEAWGDTHWSEMGPRGHVGWSAFKWDGAYDFLTKEAY